MCGVRTMPGNPWMNVRHMSISLSILFLLLGEMNQPLVAQTGTTTELTVFAAASLSEAFQTLGNNFEARHHGVKLQFNFGGSQQLVQQMVQGAKADIFASANMKQMTGAIKSGVIDTATVRTFARNRLVVIVPKDNPAHLTQLKDLAKGNIKLILADSSVPAGQYSLQVLDLCSKLHEFGASFRHNVLKNVVSYEENVRAVLIKVRIGECDAGIVYTSDIVHDSLQSVHRIEIPDSLNVIAEYPVALVREGTSRRLAGEFLEYLLSDEGSRVLWEYGFIGVNRSAERR